MKPEKDSKSVPPKLATEEQADAELDAAVDEAKIAAKRLDASATSLKRTISDSKMKAVRLPTPSQLEMPPEKR